MAKFLKENWFVALVGVFLIIVGIIFTYDQNKGKLPGKTINGEQVVFSVGEQNFTANNLYDKLKENYYEADVYLTFYKALLNTAVKDTNELTKEIDDEISATINYYTQSYGYGEDYLDYIAQYNYGYTSFREYVRYTKKAETLLSNYVSDHIDEFYTDEFVAKNSPRIVNYVVITMDDPKNPTAEETAKLKEAQDAWASDNYNADNFEDFAKAYSQDGGASSGGKFGYIDKTTTGVDKVFIDTSVIIKEGEVSDWTYSDMYGYYLIKCTSTKVEDFKDETNFLSAILGSVENLERDIMWKTAQDLGVTFSDPEIEKIVKENLGFKESDGTSNESN